MRCPLSIKLKDLLMNPQHKHLGFTGSSDDLLIYAFAAANSSYYLAWSSLVQHTHTSQHTQVNKQNLPVSSVFSLTGSLKTLASGQFASYTEIINTVLCCQLYYHPVTCKMWEKQFHLVMISSEYILSLMPQAEQTCMYGCLQFRAGWYQKQMFLQKSVFTFFT